MNGRRHFLAALALAAMAGFAPADAQDYPSKPIKIVVPFSPGASNDTLARITADALTPRLVAHELEQRNERHRYTHAPLLWTEQRGELDERLFAKRTQHVRHALAHR